MPLNPSSGNMYPFTDYTHNPIRGKCPFSCVYCFMRHGQRADIPAYQRPLQLITSELNVKYKPGKVHFIGSACDMWCDSVSDDDIAMVLDNCCKQSRQTPGALEKPTFLFQSKNPERFRRFVGEFPERTILGTTVETNDMDVYGDTSKAPSPMERIAAMAEVQKACYGDEQFLLSIEPIMKWRQNKKPWHTEADNMDFIGDLFSNMFWDIVSIGADSCDALAQEKQPAFDLVWRFINDLKETKWNQTVQPKIYVKPNIAELAIAVSEKNNFIRWLKTEGLLAERKEEPKVDAQMTLL